MAGPSPATGVHSTGNIKRIHRVQSVGGSFDLSLEDINEYGKLAAVDRKNIEGINAPLEFTYLLTDLENEKNLGFNIDSGQSALALFLNGTQEDRNYFRVFADEGLDAEGLAASEVAVMGVGNGYLASYSVEASVGSFPTVSVSVEGLNVASYLDGVAQNIPAVVPTTGRKASGTFTLPTIPASSAGKPSAVRPGDVRVIFSNTDAGVFQSLATAEINIQSFSMNFDLNLESIGSISSRLPVSREISYPLEVSVSIESLLADIQPTNLVDFLCQDEPTDITVNFYNDNCDADGPSLDEIYAQFVIKNAKLTSQDLSGSIGPNHTASFEFTSQVGAANDTANGVFMSGVTGYSGVTPVWSP